MGGLALGFPVWIRATHWINVLFIGFLIRAGIQILGGYPRLYRDDNCTPGTEWLKLTRHEIPKDRPWTALEQEISISPWIGQPGGNNLGLGRHWHFFAVIFWTLNGLAYVVMLAVTNEWRRLVPTTWSIFPAAWHTFVAYVTLSKPPDSAFRPYDPLQQLAYFGVVFILAPLLILTGAAQSPAVEARYPWYLRLFGGRQRARSLHFLGLVAFVIFIIVHVTLVAYTGFSGNMANIIFGHRHDNPMLAVAIGLALIAAIIVLYGVTSWYSRRSPRTVKRALGAVIYPPMSLLSLRSVSRQEYAPRDISPVFLINGYPPKSPEYEKLRAKEWRDWRLEVRGLVSNPLTLSLADLESMPPRTQITKHQCIQGWCSVASWTGVSVSDLIRRCQPLADARYAVFWSYQQDLSDQPFYETLDLRIAMHPQTILAHTMNGEPLSVAHGAPLRMRVETQLGFKMVKWLKAIEFVADYRSIGAGQGGSREDNMNYEQSVSI
jgi:DMSO/TMAO reductase YedYZ molybdopterin-dependent catalytic subunit/thiosulfate reductase cytochrome b subunit